MHPFLLVLRKDLRRKIRSPLAPIVFLLFPVVFSLLIGITFGSRGDRIAPIRIALVDEDEGLLARLLRSSFTQGRMPQRLDVKVVEMPEAHRLIEKNKISAIVRIPNGFSDSLLSARTSRLEVVKNPAQSIYPQIVEEMVGGVAKLGGGAIRFFNEPIREIREGVEGRTSAPPDELIARTSIAINHRMRAVGRYAFPPAIRMETAEAEEASGERPTPFRITLFVLPGMAIYALLMLALSGMTDMHREAAHGTLSRQLVTPIPGSAVLYGKIASVWVLSLCCIVILSGLALSWAGGGVNLPGFVILSVAFALGATGIAAIIYALFASERAAGAFGSLLITILSMIGGAFIPLDQLPAGLQRAARITPIYWGAEGYRSLLFESASLADLLPNIAILGGIGIVLLALASRVFHRRFASGAGAR